VTVPDVRGKPADEAGNLLRDAQLQVEVADWCSGTLVTGQSLSPGDHPQNSRIVLEICG
jgi:serine/threonine-protein kinase